MPHNGPSAWPSDENGQPLPDCYGQRDMNGTDALDPPVFNAKGRRRYLGGSAEFADRLRSWLQEERRMSGSSTADAAAVTAFHAQAAATLTMLQMALELAPQGDGWGFSFDDLFKASKVESALRAFNASTFWGQLSFDNHEHYNSAYHGGLAQFPALQPGGQCAAVPQLIGPASFDFELAQPVYPAAWPCELTDTCPPPPPAPGIHIPTADDWEHFRRWFGIGFWPSVCGVILALLLCCCAIVRCCSCLCRRKSRGSRNEFSMLQNALRESMLSGKELPDIALASNDVDARWVETARRHSEYVHASEQSLLSGGAIGSSGSPAFAKTVSRSLSGQTTPLSAPSPRARVSALARTNSAASISPSSQKGRKPKAGPAAPRLVMFSNGHLTELRPQNWHRQKIGSGSSGTVYHASWRDQEVAIKEFSLPSVPPGASDKAVQDMRKTIRRITQAYVKEVDLCCDMAHPNLVRFLGYATKPRLVLVQELLPGQSLDKQLYVEKWEPQIGQILKMALDIASGMEYLHTSFEQPIIHRDLKSPNLLLASPPPPSGAASSSAFDDIFCKITDFGLSKDLLELNDDLMTKCGSTLWMAPEMLLGEPSRPYNEKVDVYSFAMCLVEMIDCKLPWYGHGGTAQVPLKVTQGERPTAQLRKAAGEAELIALIKRCWDGQPRVRPSFTEIVNAVDAMLLSRKSQSIDDGLS